MQKKPFLIITLLHLLLVMAAIIAFSYEQTADAARYLWVANEFASLGNWTFDPAQNCNTAPGYPIFLAIIKPFTQHNKLLIALLQSLLYSSALYYLLYQLFQKKLFTYPLCVVSFALVLFSPELFHANGFTLTESFCASAILIIATTLLDKVSSRTSKTLFVVATCCLILTKFEYLAILPVFLLVLFFTKKYALIFTTTLSLTVLLLLNGAKNYQTYGDFNLFGYGSGSVIYGGNNLNGDGSWHITTKNLAYLPATKLDTYHAINQLEPTQICLKKDSLYKQMALEAWQTDWVFQLKIIPIKFLKLWFLPATLDFYTGQKEFKKGLQLNVFFDDTRWPWYGKYKHGVYLLVYWCYLALIIFGIYLKTKKHPFDNYDCFMLALFLIVSLMYSVPFYGLSRFHVPIFGLFILYASFAIQYIDATILKTKLLDRIT